MVKRQLAVLVFTLIFALGVAAPALAFSDVPSNHPYADAINDLAARGFISGHADGTFGPGEPVARCQFAKMIVNTLGIEHTDLSLPFVDVGSGDLPEFVAAAARTGITKGTNAAGTLFSPWNTISRAQVITMVVRALDSEHPGLLRDTTSPSLWGRFDATHGPTAAKAQANGLLAGLPLASLSSWGAMPRGEVAQVLHNLLDLIEHPEARTFASSIKPIDEALKAEMLKSGSWKPGDPVSLDELRLIQVSYWGFDQQAHTGSLVVNSAWAAKLCTVFQKLYDARFPIHRMDLIDVYGADDERSMAADNTSAYNGRYVSGSPGVWSMHAYGLAVDLNPVENPWVDGTDVSPAAGRPYADRSLEAPGMVHAGDLVVRAFASIGWKWGGSWSGAKDYQHFSSNGK